MERVKRVSKKLACLFGLHKRWSLKASLLSLVTTACLTAKAATQPTPTNGWVTVTVAGVAGNYTDRYGNLDITTNTVLSMAINFNTNRLVSLGGGYYNDYKGTATFTILAPGGTTNITTTNGVGVTILNTNDTGDSFAGFSFGNLDLSPDISGGVALPNTFTNKDVRTGVTVLASQWSYSPSLATQFQGPQGASGRALGAVITNVVVQASDMGYPRPQLSTKLSGTNLILTWPTNVPGYKAQSSSLGLGTWSTLTNLVTTNTSGVNQITIPMSRATGFSAFRLVHP